jgi:hypothetical protein
VDTASELPPPSFFAAGPAAGYGKQPGRQQY